MTMTRPRISAHFELRKFDCDPNAVTVQLGVRPSETWQKGDPIGHGGARRKYSGWRLLASLPDQIELEPLVLWLLDHLPHRLDLTPVAQRWEAQISLVVRMSNQAPAMFFSSGTLRRIADLDANLDVDLYLDGEDER